MNRCTCAFKLTYKIEMMSNEGFSRLHFCGNSEEAKNAAKNGTANTLIRGGKPQQHRGKNTPLHKVLKQENDMRLKLILRMR